MFLGDKEIHHGTATKTEDNKAFIYIRPYHFDIYRSKQNDTISSAIIEHISPAGSHVRVELLDEFQQPILVEIPIMRYKELGIKKGDKVFVSPKETRVFFDESQDYTI